MKSLDDSVEVNNHEDMFEDVCALGRNRNVPLCGECLVGKSETFGLDVPCSDSCKKFSDIDFGV